RIRRKERARKPIWRPKRWNEEPGTEPIVGLIPPAAEAPKAKVAIDPVVGVRRLVSLIGTFGTIDLIDSIDIFVAIEKLCFDPVRYKI
ncbi:MAG: hypothetical protein KDD12_22990, partial [Lewinella sp.]|nr:hypothetical protein [Lewinella sp.]